MAFHPHNQPINTAQAAQSSGSENMLALGPSQSTVPNFHVGDTSNLISYRGFEDFCPEDEIRIRSHEMLENEDMQHLLCVFSMGSHGHASSNGNERLPRAGVLVNLHSTED
ncbi:unnamed protein product [Fraxinus pennsylvanica]|uniref:Uncharacterized protein n=1 Tax=Fraxinus pennsylvanica TaxID=56036 RepID=A0AAD2DQT3_9LAMI|nr:unnamed protein product [Fraxinus pennsylvanica]